jgi:hypothetical protein
LLEGLQELWHSLRRDRRHGLLYERRTVAEGREKAGLRGAALAEVVVEFQGRCAATSTPDAEKKTRLRDAVMHEAGALTYDHVQGEFHMLGRQLQWPARATLKDLRHCFATAMNNAAMPEAYRRYLLGHAPGKAAILAYTHLNELRRHYEEAVQKEWMPLVEAIRRRLHVLVTS